MNFRLITLHWLILTGIQNFDILHYLIKKNKKKNNCNLFEDNLPFPNETAQFRPKCCLQYLTCRIMKFLSLLGSITTDRVMFLRGNECVEVCYIWHFQQFIRLSLMLANSVQHTFFVAYLAIAVEVYVRLHLSPSICK